MSASSCTRRCTSQLMTPDDTNCAALAIKTAFLRPLDIVTSRRRVRPRSSLPSIGLAGQTCIPRGGKYSRPRRRHLLAARAKGHYRAATHQSIASDDSVESQPEHRGFYPKRAQFTQAANQQGLSEQQRREGQGFRSITDCSYELMQRRLKLQGTLNDTASIVQQAHVFVSQKQKVVEGKWPTCSRCRWHWFW